MGRTPPTALLCQSAVSLLHLREAPREPVTTIGLNIARHVYVRNPRSTQLVVATLYLMRGEVWDGEKTTTPYDSCGGECHLPRISLQYSALTSASISTDLALPS